MSKKLRIPAFLMILSIIIITAFQTYWLRKNYLEEKKLFSIHTNLLFRETVLGLEATKLNLDTNVNIKINDKFGVISVSKALQQRMITDTVVNLKAKNPRNGPFLTFQNKKGAHITTTTTTTENNSRITYVEKGPNNSNRIYEFLVNVDSLRQPITVKDITASYQKALQKEKIDVPFIITAIDTPTHRKIPFLPDPEDNSVVIGFSKPVTYKVNFENATWYLIKRLTQPILISFFLIGVTIFSFLLLYRNLIRQSKLTQLKNDFIGNITHELKTPIATVSVAIEAMKNFNALDNPARTEEYLDISANELQRLSLLVDKVLKLSMFEKREIALKKEPVDLVKLSEDVINSMKLQFEKQRATVKLEITGKNFVIEADRMHMTSVIYNLLDNALKYSKGTPEVTVHVIDHTKYIEVCVKDNGIGIAKEYRTKIFEQFFRVPSGNRHNIKGYGLGLSYVSHIVQRHMGFIEVDSEPGIGSTFSVKLPFAEAALIEYDKGRSIRKIAFKLGKS